WNASNGATAYRLQISTSNTFSSFVSGYSDLPVGSALSRDITGLNPGIKYYYRVRAENAAGASNYSASASATTESRIISLSGDLNFGNVQAGQTPSRTLTIRNDGNTPLQVDRITITSPGFSVDWSG